MRGIPRRASPYGVALLSVGTASLVAWLVGAAFEGAVTPPFFAAVVVSAWFGGLRPGLLATLLAAVASETFFQPSRFGVDWGSVLRFGMFCLVAALTSSLYARSQEAQRQAERLLTEEQQARAEAETANRAKDEFLASLSHELRTPLNAMLGWTWWLRNGTLSGEKATRALETVDRNARLLAQLIEDLLDVSRAITGKLRLERRTIDLARTVQAAVETVTPAAQAKLIELDADVGPARSVFADGERLQQVVWNLLSNAVKFTPELGRVTVRVSSDDTHAVIEVSDTGRGIRAADLPNLFARFHQVRSEVDGRGGLGLGLSIVRHIVELHGGTVAAASPGEGRGATFTVRLPLGGVDVPSAVEEPGTGPSEVPPTLDQVHVLLVDDDVGGREVLAVALQRYGAQVTVVGSVAEALDACARERPDVLVSDIRMPGGSGYDLILSVRASERDARTPAVALTAYPRVEDRARALAAGYDMHVPKPVSPVALARAIATLAGRD